MKVWILTLFPDTFKGTFGASILRRAQDKGLLEITFINIRDFATDKHKTVDDKPYGGGNGMVLKVDVLAQALDSIKPKPFTILLSASGIKFDQKKAFILSKKRSIALICGHYEGIDARFEKYVDMVMSIGDFVLTGGEIAAMAIVDSISRLVPGVITKESLSEESFSPVSNLEYPQFTRPQIYRGIKVPTVLMSGNHKKINAWRKEQSIKRTKKYRPDLLKS